MRIVVDMQGAQSESRFRGIGRYTSSLALAIARNAGEHEIWLALNSAFPESVVDIREAFRGLVPQEHIRVFEVPLPVRQEEPSNKARAEIAESIREYFLEQLNPDIVLVTSLFEGFVDDAIVSVGQFSNIKTALVLYDLIPYIMKDVYLETNTLYKDFYLKKIDYLKKTDLLLSISDSSKTEAIEHLKIDENSIENISASIENSFTPITLTDDEQKNFLNRYKITKKILLYAPGGFDVRKNFENLIRAFSLLPTKLREQYQLVIVSKIQEGNRIHLESIAKDAGLKKDELVLTGYVSDDDLKKFYSQCELFVFPSLHEGFGLPVLEAMACGAAVIGSNTTSVPEVIGLEKALFDPYNVESISQKIEDVLRNRAFRLELKEHALVQAKKFSWDESAKKAIKHFEKSIDAKNILTWKEKTENFKTRFEMLIIKLSTIISQNQKLENDLKNIAKVLESNELELKYALRHKELKTPIIWRVEGPFDSSYSLALLNRETARALDELGHKVILHSTEGPGDFVPNASFLEKNQDLKTMNNRVSKYPQEVVDVCSRNLYPPRVKDMKSPMNILHHYAWEESAFPQKWVHDFNQSLQGITCLSKHVQKVMLDNGVTVPLSTSSCGVDHWERIIPDVSYKLNDQHKFKFLHVSSCFPRKGADVLLKSYGDAFCKDDDIVLVIKTFSNPHNEIHQWLLEAKNENKNYPDVVIIEEDLSEEQLKSLYEQCDALIGPSRAEGFGLPFAEAMLSGLPVITTGWSGQLDFCSSETAWLIDYTFTPAKTHFSLFNSVWAEPSREHLAILMREVYEIPKEKRLLKPQKGRKLLLEKFKWIDVAERLVDSTKIFSSQTTRPKPRIGWITTWNTKCGIATYSEHLLGAMYSDVSILANHTETLTSEDAHNVYRCWQSGEDDTLVQLEETINELALDTIVIQFNYGFYNFEQLNKLIKTLKDKDISIVVMLHATKDPQHVPHKKLEQLVDSFKKCDRLLVHSYGDLNRLKDYGLVENVSLFPHGILDWEDKRVKKKSEKFTIVNYRAFFSLKDLVKSIEAMSILIKNVSLFPYSILNWKSKKFTIASYGFFLPHKGFIELIEAISILTKKGVNIQLNMINAEYPDPVSSKIIEEAKERVNKLELENNVNINTTFLTDEESLKELSKADLIVFPYQETGESASGAVRYGLAAEKPIVVTPLAIFDDVDSAVFKLPGVTPSKLAEGIEDFMNNCNKNSDKVKQKKIDADRWRDAHRYSNLGARLNNILVSLSWTRKNKI